MASSNKKQALIASEKGGEVGAVIFDIEGGFADTQTLPGAQGLAVERKEAVSGNQFHLRETYGSLPLMRFNSS